MSLGLNVRPSEGQNRDVETVYGTESNGNVLAWRQEKMSLRNGLDRLKLRKLTSPLLLGRSVVVGDGEGWVHFLSRTDGAPLNRVSTDSSGIAAAPVVAADTLVVIT